MRRLSFLLTSPLCGMLLWPDDGAAARPGTLRGPVEPRRGAPSNERRPTVSDLGAPPVRVADSTVGCLPDSATWRIRADQSGTYRDGPAERDVRAARAGDWVGTTVICNNDHIFTTCSALGRPFDLGRYAAGPFQTRPLDAPGVVLRVLRNPPHMNAHSHLQPSLLCRDG